LLDQNPAALRHCRHIRVYFLFYLDYFKMHFSLKGAISALILSVLFASSASAQFVIRSHKTAPSVLPQLSIGMPSNFGGYFELNTGVNFQHDATLGTASQEGGLGVPLGFTLGLESDLGLAAEFEYTYRDGDMEVGGLLIDSQSHTMMANLLYYAKTPDLLVEPYIGAGIGYIDQSVEVAGIDGSGGELAWQFIGGVRQNLNRNVAITYEYRYQDSREIDIDYSIGTTATLDTAANSSLMMGVQMRY
jgi:opacity protein-like surface antigen